MHNYYKKNHRFILNEMKFTTRKLIKRDANYQRNRQI